MKETLMQNILARASGPSGRGGDRNGEGSIQRWPTMPWAFWPSRPFKYLGAERVWDGQKIVIHIEHNDAAHPGPGRSGQNGPEFVRQHKIKYFDRREGIAFHVPL